MVQSSIEAPYRRHTSKYGSAFFASLFSTSFNACLKSFDSTALQIGASSRSLGSGTKSAMAENLSMGQGVEI